MEDGGWRMEDGALDLLKSVCTLSMRYTNGRATLFII